MCIHNLECQRFGEWTSLQSCEKQSRCIICRVHENLLGFIKHEGPQLQRLLLGSGDGRVGRNLHVHVPETVVLQMILRVRFEKHW